VDSHCHLQADRFAPDVDLVLGGARLAGVVRILVPGWDPASSRAALALTERFPWLDAAVGVHPHDAARIDEGAWRDLEALGQDERVVAIGETGLDYDRQFSPPDAQRANLDRNLELAIATGKPAILHCRSAAGRRDAQDALVGALRAAGFGSPDVAARFEGRPPAVIHSYSGPIDFAEAVLSLGLAISISGLAFRIGEEATADVVRLVPADRLLVETDAPFLSPPGAPRKRNEPEWVRITAAWVAARRDENLATFGERLVGAYDAVFSSAARRPASSANEA
jgi:TatD DNase family protein